MRTLEWCFNLGLVEIELEIDDKVYAYNVTPPKAILIWHFKDQGINLSDHFFEMNNVISV